MLLRGPDDVARVHLEDQPDKEGPLPLLAVVVDFYFTIFARRVPEVLDHLPQPFPKKASVHLKRSFLLKQTVFGSPLSSSCFPFIELHRHDHIADNGR